ncbi:2'-5' RNA ligase family protein [Nocardia uniformis]|uniref:2'-5' RNA ligase family protein n=1 Tax=Nocardia uniformis TaxID=53432 RepID=A0A849C524_9NOCA|nr:2'-5' RNA ligase family protein [Nocardia uniformis]NNH71520.1 2'-5' RNA ligase family protein [Nocardia uniformis]
MSDTRKCSFPPLPASTSDPDVIRANDWTAFREVDSLHSHWAVKNWPPGRSGLYWYLTFDNPELTSLAARCQGHLESSDIDPVPPTGLHITLLGLGDTDSLSTEELVTVADLTSEKLTDIDPFELHIGPITGSRSAIRLSVAPWDPLLDLHRVLRECAARVLPGIRLSETSSFRPHMGIGYLNRRQGAADLIAEVSRLRDLPPVPVLVRQVHLVELWRAGHRYRWSDRAVVPLRDRPHTT